jgi:prepilin-type N-terminal cleavage/methylation domain-containing protein
MTAWAQKQKGFTIVELLIVVVVIAILAAITIVAYNGIQDRARFSAAQATLSQTAKQLESFKVTNTTERYPTSSELASAYKIDSSVQYSVNPNGTGYCAVTTNGSKNFYITQASVDVREGSCVTADGLMGWWPMNNSPDDMSGNNVPSTGVSLTSSQGQDGKADNAYTFNGTSSRILCGTDDFLKLTSSVSISAWVRLTAASSGISGFLNYGGGGYWLTADSSRTLSFYISDGNIAGPTIPLNQWKYLVGTYKSGERKVYVDGVLVASDTKGGPISNYGGESCQIGSVKSVSNRYMTGQMDDVRIYNRVLSATEVESLYAAGAQ